jgi:hypothetical protein
MGAQTSAVSDSTSRRHVHETEYQLPLDALSPLYGPPYCGLHGQPAAAAYGACRKRIMFDIGVCEAKQVALIRFSGELTESDFSGLDRIAGNARGRAEFDCIFDFTAVEKLELATEFVAKRGELPQAFKDRERIYVVPQDDLKLLTRLYAAYQTAKGWRSPSIVATLDEALLRLGVAQADFRPVSID